MSDSNFIPGEHLFIPAVRYYKNPEYAPAGTILDAGEALDKVRDRLNEYGSVRCHFQPGDGTRYDFILIGCGDTIIVSCIMPGGFAVEVNADSISTGPNYIAGHTHCDVNPHTAAIIADVLNWVRSSGKAPRRFYDWTNAVVRKG